MAGIYIHIPFCRQACHYCNFHFSTSLRRKGEMVRAILKEIELRKEYLGVQAIETIYLGGGTPSLLSMEELDKIFESIHRLFKIKSNPEITLEANPDDLTPDYLRELKKTPVNRLSVGIQSFAEDDLRFMNRAHNAIEAKTCIEYAHDAGFDNLSIDLIYGSPSTTDKQWKKNLKTAFAYDIPHISAYCLTVEPGTALHKFVERGTAQPVDEEHSARQFEILLQMMQKYGYQHYEISNFAHPGKHARHNTNYWNGVPYLGVGPSAHSFNGTARQWNIANNARYIQSLQEDKIPGTEELLTAEQRYNEYIMTSLRTIWGCDPKQIAKRHGKKMLTYFNEKVIPFINNETVGTDGKKYFLTDKGKLLADNIAVELFV